MLRVLKGAVQGDDVLVVQRGVDLDLPRHLWTNPRVCRESQMAVVSPRLARASRHAPVVICPRRARFVYVACTDAAEQDSRQVAQVFAAQP